VAAAAAGCAGAGADSPADDPAEVGVVLTTSVPPGGANVVLNELLANERGSDVNGEFIELVNIGTATADLTGWTLSDSVMVRHTVNVPITGWSPAATDNWLVLGFVFNGAGSFAPMVGQRIALSSPLGKDHAPCFGAGMNRGIVATLPVTAPASAVSGDYAVLQIESYRIDPATCFPDPRGDQYQFSLTGVFVP
jgi:hypothetical protein